MVVVKQRQWFYIFKTWGTEPQLEVRDFIALIKPLHYTLSSDTKETGY